MKNLIYSILFGTLLLNFGIANHSALAQNAPKTEKKTKIIIQSNKNGKVEQFEWNEATELTPEKQQKLEELKAKLKEQGVTIGLDAEGKSFVINNTEENTSPKSKIRITRNINGKTEVIEEEFTGNELPVEVKKRLDAIDVSTIEKVDIDKGLNKSGEKPIKVIIHSEVDAPSSETLDIKVDAPQNDEKETKVMVFRNQEDKTIQVEAKVFHIKMNDQNAQDLVFKLDENSPNEVKEFTTADGKKVKIIFRKVEIIKEVKNTENAAQNGKSEDVLADNKIQNLNLYPNPNGGKFNLKFDLPDYGNANIGIYDMQGNKVYADDVKNTRQYDKAVDLQTQKAGVYVLRITQNGKVYTRQIQVN
jgi:Secretion system C-terminal sorting domain